MVNFSLILVLHLIFESKITIFSTKMANCNMNTMSSFSYLLGSSMKIRMLIVVYYEQ